MRTTNNIIAFAAAALFAASPVIAHEGHEHGEKDELASGETKKISGEVIDMACYIDHNATGDKHAACAKKCIVGSFGVMNSFTVMTNSISPPACCFIIEK